MLTLTKFGYIAHYPKCGTLAPAEFTPTQVFSLIPWADPARLSRAQAEEIVGHWNALGKAGGYRYEVVVITVPC